MLLWRHLPLQKHRAFLAPVSGMCVMQIWDWIRLVPDSGTN